MPNRTIQKLLIAHKSTLDKTRQPIKNRKAISALTQCQTRDMGVSLYACPERHEMREQFHSCRHRSCYVCAQRKRLEWIEKQKDRLLNTPHFHVIFTLPHEFLPLWRYNEALFTQILFTASQKSLLELMEDRRHCGVTPGILMALHTWGRQLTLHPHTHCLVTAGGLQPDGKWKATGEFLLPGSVLRRYYRGKVQSLIKTAFERGELRLPPDMTAQDFWRQHRCLYRKEWSVRIEERYGHGKGVMLYLARYCKGGPFNPKQIVSSNGREIEMRYLDHRDQRIKHQRLKPLQLIQRLLQHVPAMGVHTARYYGLYAPAAKRRHAEAVAQHGSLQGIEAGRGLDMRTVLLCCKKCGAPEELVGRQWRKTPKGNSLIKSSGRLGGRGSVQQDDAPYIASVPVSGLMGVPP